MDMIFLIAFTVTVTCSLTIIFISFARIIRKGIKEDMENLLKQKLNATH